MGQYVALFSLKSSCGDFWNRHTDSYVPCNVTLSPLSTVWNESAKLSQGAPTQQNPRAAPGSRGTGAELLFAVGVSAWTHPGARGLRSRQSGAFLVRGGGRGSQVCWNSTRDLWGEPKSPPAFPGALPVTGHPKSLLRVWYQTRVKTTPKLLAKPRFKYLYLYFILLILVTDFITYRAVTSVLYKFIAICWERKNLYLSS